MSRKAWVLAGLVVVLCASHASAQMRLEGLDRLYFARIAEPGGQLPESMQVASLLPETLPKPGFIAAPSDEMETEGDIEEDFEKDIAVRDFELPSRSLPRRLWIREIIDRSHPRIFELWWALYDGGRRSDVWHFSALPDRTDGKLLSNYQLYEISMPRKDIAVFRVQGEMFRPQGAWWVVGKEWSFAVRDGALALTRVRNPFGFFRGYDTGEKIGSLSATTERERRGRVEIRTLEPIPEKPLAACGFRDPTEEGGWDFSWKRLLEVAQCLTGKPGAKVTFRELNAPSFVERDGKFSG